MAWARRVQPAQGAQGSLFEIGGVLGQNADRSPRAGRKVDQGTRSRECGKRRVHFATGEARQRTQSALGPRAEPDKRHGGTQALGRIGRTQAVKATERHLVAATETPRRWLKHPAASQRCRRALRAQNKWLAVHRNDGLGED